MSAVTYRHPTVRDAPAVTRLIRDSGNLDVNSHYAHLLLCHHFHGTCMVAARGSELIGFVSAYRPPEDPGVLFVWQIAVASSARGAGVAGGMLDQLVQRASGGRVHFVEATITASNAASIRLFTGFARRQGVAIAHRRLFPVELFHGVEQHESEDLFRIGPLPSTSCERNGVS
jgi:L-2,4-diaminobutyric acid acetyltransferase